MAMRRRPDISELSFDDTVEALAVFAADAVSPFSDRSPKDQEARKARAADDPFYFFKNYLPHYFGDEPPEFHREMVELASILPDRAAGEIITTLAIAAPTGFAKSTVLSFGFTLWEVLTGRTNFTIIGSETSALAEDHVASIAAELAGNRRIIYDFRPRIKSASGGNLVLVGGPRVYARGAGQQLRGLKHKAARPDRIMLDDLESDESAKNPKRVKKILDWILGAVLSRFGKTGRLHIIGTLIHHSSALATILKSPDEPWCNWPHRKIYRALIDGADGAQESLWPQRFPVCDLLALKSQMGSIAFAKEKQNDPRDAEAMFQPEWIKEYQPEELRTLQLAKASFVDPSLGSGESHDYKAVITVGLDLATQVFYVLDAWIKKATIDQMCLAVVERARTLDPLVFGVEDNLFQRLLLGEFARAAEAAQVTIPLSGVTHNLPKETRISGLSPLVERGMVRFCRAQGDQRLLIEQLVHFPSANVNDDGPDGLEGAVALLKPHVHKLGYESAGKRRSAAGGGGGTW